MPALLINIVCSCINTEVLQCPWFVYAYRTLVHNRSLYGLNHMDTKVDLETDGHLNDKKEAAAREHNAEKVIFICYW